MWRIETNSLLYYLTCIQRIFLAYRTTLAVLLMFMFLSNFISTLSVDPLFIESNHKLIGRIERIRKLRCI